MGSDPVPSQQQIDELAPGRCAERDDGRKFWRTDRWRMIGGVVTAVRTGEPVLHDDPKFISSKNETVVLSMLPTGGVGICPDL